MRYFLSAIFILGASSAMSFVFSNIDGGNIDTKKWEGQPFLIVNTASKCGFTRQYKGLQKLFDTYRNDGFIVLAVPSNDFKQELKSNEAVKEFCELDLGLNIPMTEITSVKGNGAHPKFNEKEKSFVEKWNFNKILISATGEIIETYGSFVNQSQIFTNNLKVKK